MSRRRRKILIVCLALVVGIALATWFGSQGGRAEVKVVFLGFANLPKDGFIYSTGSGLLVTTQTMCLLLVTNAGSETLRRDSFRFQRESKTERPYFPKLGIGVDLFVGSIPHELKAGESEVGYFFPLDETNAYRLEVGFRRAGVRDRLSDLCDRIGWDYGAEKFSSSDNTNDLLWFSTGWITNPPAMR
jgi:hypothetical protein